MNYKIVKYGKKRERRNYSRVKSNIDLPNLIEVQTDSFDWFIKEGLKELFKDISPIENPTQDLELYFENFEFGDSKYTISESKEKDKTYAKPLHVNIKLLNKRKDSVQEISEQKVYLGDIPFMTSTGSFIINGSERVIVSQIVRSAGVFFDTKVDKKTLKRKFEGQVIPNRGAWLEYDIDSKDILYVKLDRSKKIPLTTLLKSLGLNLEQLNYLYRNNALIRTTLKRDTTQSSNEAIIEIYTKLRQGEIAKSYQAQEFLISRLFNSKRYELAEVGRYKINKKLNILNHIRGKRLAQDIVNPETGEVILEKDTPITRKEMDILNRNRESFTQTVPGVLAASLEYDFEIQRDILMGNPYLNSIRISKEDFILSEGTKAYQDTLEDLEELLNSSTLTKDDLNAHPFLNTLSAKEKTKILKNKEFSAPETYADLHLKSINTSLEKYLYDEGLRRYELMEKAFEEMVSENDITMDTLDSNPYLDYLTLEEKHAYLAQSKTLTTELCIEDYFRYLTVQERLNEIKSQSYLSVEEYVEKVLQTKQQSKKEFVKANGQNAYDDMVESITTTLNDEKLYFELAKIEVLDIYHRNREDEEVILRLIGNHSLEDKEHIVPSDIIASIAYYLNLYQGYGRLDDIDHLGNRRLRLIGELLKNHFRIGLSKLEKNVKDRMSTNEQEVIMTPQKLINNRPLISTLKEFFGSSQLSQFMSQTNPLDELTHKRRISALGPGGLTRDRAGFEVRDVHYSHYGRICPIETPEGQNIGLINSLASYVRVNRYGFIETPYLHVNTKELGDDQYELTVTDEVVFMAADEEEQYYIGQANIALDDDNRILNENVVARYMGETKMFARELIEYIDVSPKQIVSISTACIPFLEHDDANRALMGANMQRQAIPLLRPEAAFVGTGIEYKAAKDSGSCLIALNSGTVKYVDAKNIIIEREDKQRDYYNLTKFERSNQGTCINQKPIVTVGEEVTAGEIITDGPSMDQGELALGRNVTVAFMTWNGYNYEDAIILSERLVKEDIYTSIHIEKYEAEARETKLGKEEITREIPNVGEEGRRFLDDRGIIIPGAEVEEGDILVGKITPKGQTDPTPEDKLLLAIFGEKSREVRDTSLRVPHGGGGIVQSVKYFSRANDDELPPGANEVVQVFIVQKRKISEGDKMAGRHGNKGVISKILPEEDMPYLPDGTPIDIMLNPLGVPSRMNIGQVLEIHLGMAAKKLGIHVATPVFDGVENDDLVEIMKEANMQMDGKIKLYSGRTGIAYDNDVSVGIMHMIKLDHMVDDKLHARSVGPYTLVTQQPMGGKAQNGGQRFGEMEVWALEAYGAAYCLQEMLTVKSDDIIGRNKVFRAIVDGKSIPGPSLPESFRVLTRELQALGIYVELISRETKKNEANKSLVEDSDVEDYLDKYGFNS